MSEEQGIEWNRHASVIWDEASEKFLIFDREKGDWVRVEIWKRRRLWYHTCPDGRRYNYTKDVKICSHCGAAKGE